MVERNSLTLSDGNADPRRVFRAKRGDVRIAVLDLLDSEGPSTGYKLMQLIREKSGGVWKVSSGSIYPTLERLASEHLLRVINYPDAVQYALTERGQSVLSTLTSEVSRIWNMEPERNLDNLEPLEKELAKLSEAIELATRTNPQVTNKIFHDVVFMRKKIFRYLSE